MEFLLFKVHEVNVQIQTALQLKILSKIKVKISVKLRTSYPDIQTIFMMQPRVPLDKVLLQQAREHLLHHTKHNPIPATSISEQQDFTTLQTMKIGVSWHQ